jgi:hypothetical protein
MEERFETSSTTTSSSNERSSTSSCDEEEDDLQSSSEDSSQSSNHNDKDILSQQDEFQVAVRQWAHRIVLGLGLCPWAVSAQRRRRLLYYTCHATIISEVTSILVSQIQHLLSQKKNVHNDKDEPWWTLLFICPNVQTWNEKFTVFEDFVRTLPSCRDLSMEHRKVLDQTTLVAFHPHFVRWYCLPSGIQKGSVVQAHQALPGLQKSPQRYEATVLETQCPAFGRRKVRVQFKHLPKPQYIPTDWCHAPITSTQDNIPSSSSRQPLCDNAMHRSPYPTIHVLRNHPDLVSLPLREVSRVKRRNAQRMMKLGWDGLPSNEK